jgi:hypothetical protein
MIATTITESPYRLLNTKRFALMTKRRTGFPDWNTIHHFNANPSFICTLEQIGKGEAMPVFCARETAFLNYSGNAIQNSRGAVVE